MRERWLTRTVAAAALTAWAGWSFAADGPVKIIATQATEIRTPSGVARLPVDVSLDWSQAQPQVTRAVILVHGKGRDVDGYYKGLEQAAREAGAAGKATILIAPQFLNDGDVAAHQLPGMIVRWPEGKFQAGGPALAPAPISAYEALDALLLNLTDKRRFPNLKDVVVAGHSAGGQAVQRYAVVGHAAPKLAAQGIHLRFVIANPSSYLYFSEDRPAPHGTECARWNRWLYGINDPPPYVLAKDEDDWKRLEAAYAAADVIYLLGEEDTNPKQKDLDTSCSGEAEGSTRLERGESYFKYLRARHADGRFGQRVWLVEGVGHQGPKMVESLCGVDALFATGLCKDESLR